MGGGKKKKTITAAEKAQKREEVKEVKKPEKREKTSPSLTEIDESILSKALSTIKSSDVVTTHQLATALGIKMSLARKLIRELSAKGEIKVIDKFRSLYIVSKLS